MVVSEASKRRRNIGFSIMAGVMAFTVLFISIARASLEIASSKELNSEVRKMEIEVDIKGEKFIYKFPQARTLPDDPTYFFKKIRDFLWLNFAGSPSSKSDVALFIADKKMAEAQVLLSKNKTDLALATSREALNKLKYARSIHYSDQIYRAGWAYEKILANYNQKLEELDEWNTKQVR